MNKKLQWPEQIRVEVCSSGLGVPQGTIGRIVAVNQDKWLYDIEVPSHTAPITIAHPHLKPCPLYIATIHTAPTHGFGPEERITYRRFELEQFADEWSWRTDRAFFELSDLDGLKEIYYAEGEVLVRPFETEREAITFCVGAKSMAFMLGKFAATLVLSKCQTTSSTSATPAPEESASSAG